MAYRKTVRPSWSWTTRVNIYCKDERWRAEPPRDQPLYCHTSSILRPVKRPWLSYAILCPGDQHRYHVCINGRENNLIPSVDIATAVLYCLIFPATYYIQTGSELYCMMEPAWWCHISYGLHPSGHQSSLFPCAPTRYEVAAIKLMSPIAPACIWWQVRRSFHNNSQIHVSVARFCLTVLRWMVISVYAIVVAVV